MPFADMVEFLRQVTAFAILDTGDLMFLAEQLQPVHFTIGQVICHAGDPGDSLYLVYSGRARVVAPTAEGEASVGVLTRGNHFGEGALLSGGTRAYTVRAAEDLVLLQLHRSGFERVLERRPELRTYFEKHIADVATRNLLRLCSAFRALKPPEIQAILNELESREFPAGATVFAQGDPGDRFYLIRSGAARVIQDGRELARLSDGQFFGELALLTGSGRAATVVAETALSTQTLSSVAFNLLLNEFPRLRENIEAIAYSYQAEDTPLDDRPTIRPESRPAPPPPATTDGLAPEQRPLTARSRGRKWPMVFQIGEMDCGAACLAMIGRFYGREYRLQTMRELAEVSREGSSLRSLALAAEQLGFSARPVRAEFQHLSSGSMPLIAHWGGNHFIVVYEIRKGKVLVADPGRGLLRLSEAEFKAGWTGLALLVSPGDQLAPSEKAPTLLRRFLPLVTPYWPLLIEVLVCSLLLQVLGLATPLFTQTVVDRVLVHRDVTLLNLMLGGMVVVVLFEILATAVRQNLLVYVVRRIDVSAASQFLAHILKLPTRYFENHRVGDIVTRFGETENIRRLLTSTATTALLDGVTILIYLGIMLFYNAALTGILVVLIPAFSAIGLLITPAVRNNLRKSFEAHSEVQSHLVEAISGVQTVKAVQAERPVRWRWEELLLKYIRLQFQAMNYRLVLQAISMIMHVSVTTVLLWYGAQVVLAGKLTVGQLMAFFALSGTLMSAIKRLINVWDEFQDVRISLERLADVFDAKPEEADREAAQANLPPVRGHIKFEEVTFRYSENARTNACENISLEVLPGQTVALVGRSGSGKSTLIKLLMRLYEPTSGRLTVDGFDLSKVSLNSWRPQLGAVMQESFLFSGTIRDNIALGNPNASFEQVQRAAMMAGAHDFVAELPLGYNTMVGERGASLSGGQRQRINIARALLSNPSVLILDEATSALDTESERAIQRNLETVLKDRTTLVIAHRLSTVRNADKIVVMDRGLIVEQGTHQELMAQRGLYFYLCSQQLDQ
jgi:ATP-binding cassette subfamily B protein